MKKLKNHILIISLLIFYTVFCYVFGCPFRNIFSFPCPTCGMTHALISLLCLDFQSYINYNPMALPMAITILIAFHLNLFKHKKILTAIVVAVAIINFLVYLKRIL